MVTKASSSVLCAGILVADVFVPPLPRLPVSGELLATEDFLLDSGGCAANVATGLAKLGVSTTVVGKVGKDVFGDFIIQDMAKKGVGMGGIQRSAKAGTSKTVVLSVKGEDRRFIHTFGANTEFRVQDIDTALVAEASVLYLGGYLILPGVDQTELAELFRQAREQGVQTVLDVVVPGEGNPHTLSSLEKVLPFTDLFLPNDTEAQALTGETDPRRQAKAFRSAGCDTVLITMGARGTLLVSPEETLEAETFPIEMVDGSGAGDAFAAGFLAALLDGSSRQEALRFASAIGASACTKLGCTTGVFTRPEAEAFLQTHSLTIRRFT